MVLPAQVTHLEQAGYPLCQARNPAEATTRDPAGQGSNGPQGSGRAAGSSRPQGPAGLRGPAGQVRGGSVSAAAASSPAPRRWRAGDGCRDRAGGSSFHRGSSVRELWPARQGLSIVGIMNLVRPTLTKSAAIPILHHAMTGCPSVRPEQAPILERTGQPLPTRLFHRPPMRAPQGFAPQRRVAYRSSVVNDQAHVDRCHARGRNPRGGAGW